MPPIFDLGKQKKQPPGEGLIAYGSNLETANEMRTCLAHGIDSIDSFSTGNLEEAVKLVSYWRGTEHE